MYFITKATNKSTFKAINQIVPCRNKISVIVPRNYITLTNGIRNIWIHYYFKCGINSIVFNSFSLHSR